MNAKKIKDIKCEHLNGVYSELATIIGIDAVLKIYNSYRGQQITCPVTLYSKCFIKKQIVEEYDGHNAKKLATKFGYSEKWIRQILKDSIDASE